MYAPLLANRYLTSRVIPIIAVGAVGLCVALVIIVVSVMTGFLDTLRTSGRTMMGDVVIHYPVSGIPWYEDLVADLEALPGVAAASPSVEAFGLVEMPYGNRDGNSVQQVQVWGIEPGSFARASNFEDVLWWRAPDAGESLGDDDPRADPFYHRLADGLAMKTADSDLPGAILGIHISVFNERTRDGAYTFFGGDDRRFMANHDIEVTLVPIKRGRISIEPSSERFAVVNEFQSGVYQIDKSRLLIPLDVAQRMLRMGEGVLYDESGEIDPDTGLPRELGVSPAKVTQIFVKAADGVDPTDLKEQVRATYERFHARSIGDASKLVAPPSPAVVSVLTWEEQLRDVIGPVEREREMMRILFSIVYVVCAGLVLAIFWAIVYEKTRDIGIMRATGASRIGVLWIFLRYALVIGVLGAFFGLALGALVVTRINTIHDLLGEPSQAWMWLGAFGLGLASLGFAIWSGARGSILRFLLGVIAALVLIAVGIALYSHQGFLVWDPSVYYFNRIPSAVDWNAAIRTMIGATIFSVVGAAIPAARAADTDPVHALRYE